MKRVPSPAVVRPQPNLTAGLLSFSGAILLCVAVLNLCVAGFLTRGQLPVEILKKLAKAEACLLVTGGILILLSALAKRLSGLNSLTARKEVTGALLSALILVLPLFVMELVLRPFAQLDQKTTSIYVKDQDLGWRLRPNTTQVWDHKSAKINSKGIRGPELDYDKPAGATRVLFLGDSVTFGEGLKTFEEAFPFLIGQKLMAQLKKPVEAINTGVGGYSPWQEAIYLEKEGIKYHPDLVVVTFVLNDVTEKFSLTRFGGTGEGWQLSHNYSSFSEWLADHSGVAYFARQIGARIRFGPDVQQGAQHKEALDVRSLVDFPERDDVKKAWKLTLQELDRIIDFCRGQDIPLLLVISPWRFQLLEGDVTEWLPQKIVGEHAQSRGVPVIDLLPRLVAEMKQRAEKPVDCLQKGDFCHFSAFGCQLVAEQVSEYIVAKNLLDRSKAPAAPN